MSILTPWMMIAGLLLLPVAQPIPAATADAPPVSWEIHLTPAGEPGRPFVLEGRVLDGARPLRDVWVYAYHADDRGIYSASGETRARLAGMLRTNVLGQFRIHTILPGTAEGVPHIHFHLAAPGADYRVVTLQLCRAEGPGSDSTFKRLPWMVTLPSAQTWAYVQGNSDGAFHCAWDIAFDRAVRLAKPPVEFVRSTR